MPSSFMVKRNYAHCPLKKRPFALFNESASTPEQDEPEDLSVKRPRLESLSPPHSAERFSPLASAERQLPSPSSAAHLSSPAAAFAPVSVIQSASTNYNFATSNPSSPLISYPEYQSAQHVKPITPIPVHPTPVPQEYYYSPSYGVSPPSNMVAPPTRVEPSQRQPQPMKQSSENLPTLAEYYLQLFRSTSEAEAKRNEQSTSNHLPWHEASPYTLPPSPQSSPVAQDTYRPSYVTSSMPVPAPNYYSLPMPSYPDSSALISPVSTCSSFDTEESEDEVSANQSLQKRDRKTVRHSCESCGKSYSTQSGLRKHNELHCASLGARVFSCKHCAKNYTSVGALKMHIRTHTLPCKCNVCGKAFSRPWLLQGHIRTHTGEKPFECHQCHRSFADRSNLRAHQQTHERVKKYACQICHKTFSRMSLLNKHSENVCVGVTSSSSEVSSPSSSPVSSPAESLTHHL